MIIHVCVCSGVVYPSTLLNVHSPSPPTPIPSFIKGGMRFFKNGCNGGGGGGWEIFARNGGVGFVMRGMKNF